MSALLHGALLNLPRGSVFYCPSCIDVYGCIGSDVKACGCTRSSHLVPNLGMRDFPTAFEPCYCCAGRLIPSGSRWSSYFCDRCRPVVFGANDRLDMEGRVTIPIGRHSLMHNRWRNARPFQAADRVAAFRRVRLASAWSLYSKANVGADWLDFSRALRLEGSETSAIVEMLAASISSTSADHVYEELVEANNQLRRFRRRGD